MQVIYEGLVTSVCDEYNGNRIRAKISLDGNIEPKEGWPFAFPLLPKTLQTMPKVGEMVFIILTDPTNRFAPRVYSGPIISQPQKMYLDKQTEGNPLSLIYTAPDGKPSQALETLNHFTESFGTYPKTDEIALIGRKSEDIILKDDEIDIRCGIKNYADGNENKNLVGNVLFNVDNPAYIQLKHQRNGNNNDNLVNVVGGAINLMSDKHARDITQSMRCENNVDICEDDKTTSNVSIKKPSYEEVMTKLHQIPYGDVLVEVLETMRDAILNHQHAWANEPPQPDTSINKLNTWGQSNDTSSSPDLSDILLSDTVRIS